MLPPTARLYLLSALDHTPTTRALLLSTLPMADRRWDARTAPDRFSLREVVAHLVDWEAVFADRFERMLHTESPRLLRPDPDERAATHGYATADPRACLDRFHTRRAALTAQLRALADPAWERTGSLDRMGTLTVAELAALMLAHDAYHLRQVVELLNLD